MVKHKQKNLPRTRRDYARAARQEPARPDSEDGILKAMIKLRYGNTNTYYYAGLLIDTDMPGTIAGLFRELKRHGIELKDIQYVLATHYHPDHMGLISELMSHGTRLLLVDKQKEYVHFSDPIFARQKGLNYEAICEDDAEVISCDKSRQFLAGLGIAGEIISTESHSADGIALITDDGDCFVGDLEPIQFADAYEDNSSLKADWDEIMHYHPRHIYFGHVNAQHL